MSSRLLYGGFLQPDKYILFEKFYYIFSPCDFDHMTRRKTIIQTFFLLVKGTRRRKIHFYFSMSFFILTKRKRIVK